MYRTCDTDIVVLPSCVVCKQHLHDAKGRRPNHCDERIPRTLDERIHWTVYIPRCSFVVVVVVFAVFLLLFIILVFTTISFVVTQIIGLSLLLFYYVYVLVPFVFLSSSVLRQLLSFSSTTTTTSSSSSFIRWSIYISSQQVSSHHLYCRNKIVMWIRIFSAAVFCYSDSDSELYSYYEIPCNGCGVLYRAATKTRFISPESGSNSLLADYYGVRRLLWSPSSIHPSRWRNAARCGLIVGKGGFPVISKL